MEMQPIGKNLNKRYGNFCKPFDTQTKKIGFTQINNSFLERQDLTVYEKIVGIILKKYAMNKNQCWPSIKRIAKDANCSESVVKKSIKKLEAKFFIIKRKSLNNKNNIYDIRI